MLFGEPLPSSGMPEDHPHTDSPPQEAGAESGGKNGLVDEHGHKIIPRIELMDLRSHRNGDKLLVTAWVANHSDQRIRIDNCYLLKQKRQFHQEIGPGQSHELRLYDGPAPHDENEHHATIDYRLMVNGDVFRAQYRIAYHYEHDGTRIVGGLVEDSPVRDM